jgi:benzoate/toluate 1,2-dioxygenase beta subunit
MSVVPETIIAVQQFLAREAALQDAGHWRGWLDLFTPDGIYWMPLSPDQTDARLHASLLHDDAVLREIRCRRWHDRNPDTGALSLQPAVRTVRHVSNVLVAELRAAASDGGAPSPTLEARAAVHLVEYVRQELRPWHARVTWRLVATDGDFRIALKRVDLVNGDGPISDMLTYL